ncbi:MAG: hypothetical protein ACR2KU_14680 [Gammaproteobacteria bacterium]
MDTRHLLRRRVIAGNAIAYAGMLAAIAIYLRDLPTHPLLYGVAGVAVGLGTGLAYLSLWKLRQRALR